MSKHPVAFMSYVRFDDQHENGRLSDFCERLAGEVRMQTGDKFHIFQDRNDIGWGQQWQERINESLDAVTFLVPIITPGFFKSPACRDEVERFLEREKKLGRGDLILPLYYVNCPLLNDEAKRNADELAKLIASRNYADWRELRFEPYTSPQVGKMLAKIAGQIVEALERDHPVKSPAASAAAQIEAIAKQLPEHARGPAAKTEPPTRVVDAMHRGDHATLSEALKAAQPGDRILVRPGLYRESIVIDKPVEIIGDGERSEIVIETTDKNTAQFLASMGRLANLTLRLASSNAGNCISIEQGRLDIEDCDISSHGMSCVLICGGADPRLRRNHIHSTKDGCGVFICDNGLGTLEENHIYGNKYGGVVIVYGSNPTLRRNRISNNASSAILIEDGGQGTFEENDLRGNKEGPWKIEPDCLENVKRRDNLE